LKAMAVAVLLLTLCMVQGIEAAEESSIVQPREQDIMESLRGLLSVLQDLVARLILFLPRCLCTNWIEMLRLII